MVAKILIATPCYSGWCYSGYTLSLVKTFCFFHQNNSGIELVHQFRLHDSSLPHARNLFAASALSDPSITHLLFIDADIRWQPEAILKLIHADKPIVGAICPKKYYHWEKLRQATVRALIKKDKLGGQALKEQIKANLVDYEVEFGASKQVKDGIIAVEQIPTAFMLIQRAALEKILAEYPQRKITHDKTPLPPNLVPYYYSLFDQQNNNGHYLSGDESFSQLWREVGGAFFADITINLTHYGAQVFEGNILSLAGMKPSS